MVVTVRVDDGFKHEPAELRLYAIQVLAHHLHECLTPVRVFRVRHVLAHLNLVQQLQLQLDLLLDSEQLMREVLLCFAHILAQNDEL